MTALSDQVPAVPRRMNIGVNYSHFINKPGLWFGPTEDDISPGLRGLASEGKCETETAELRQSWRTSFPILLEKFALHGIGQMRIFLLSNGWNLGTSMGNSFQLMPPSETKWANAYPTHLRELLGACKQKGMQVILSLLSFGAFEENHREKLATDPNMREEFFDRILEPLLNVTDDPEFDTTVIAWEPVNEPNWATKYWLSSIMVPLGAWNCTPGVPLAAMQTFLDSATKRILGHKKGKSRSNYLVTHGFSYGLGCTGGGPSSLGIARVSLSDETSTPFSIASAGGQYLRQFHYYPAALGSPTIVLPPGNFPPAVLPPGGLPSLTTPRIDIRNDLPSFAESGSAILGEISTAQPNWETFLKYHDPQFLSWVRLGRRDDPGEYEATFWRLVLCEQLGYQTVYLWPNRDHGLDENDPDSALSAHACLAVTDYLNAITFPRI